MSFEYRCYRGFFNDHRPHGIQAHARLFLSKSAKKQSAMGAIIKRRAVCLEADKSGAVRWF